MISTNPNKPSRLVARFKIIGPEWTFRRGQLLDGYQRDNGTLSVWPLGQHDAFLVGVPRRYVRLVRRRKPANSK